jgi:hypothetical protein
VNTPAELFFLLDHRGSLIVFQEDHTAWAGLLAFSSEDQCQKFIKQTKLEVSDIIAIDVSDSSSVAALIDSAKERAVRNLLVDLDYRTGKCVAMEFEGSRLGPSREFQFAPRRKR